MSKVGSWSRVNIREFSTVVCRGWGTPTSHLPAATWLRVFVNVYKNLFSSNVARPGHYNIWHSAYRYFNEMYKDTTEKPVCHPDTKPANVDPSTLVQRLGMSSLMLHDHGKTSFQLGPQATRVPENFWDSRLPELSSGGFRLKFDHF